MREAMADRWLGFDREDIQAWYETAGLSKVDIDCAEGTCDCCGPQDEAISLSIFVAIGQRSKPMRLVMNDLANRFTENRKGAVSSMNHCAFFISTSLIND